MGMLKNPVTFIIEMGSSSTQFTVPLKVPSTLPGISSKDVKEIIKGNPPDNTKSSHSKFSSKKENRLAGILLISTSGLV